ncbi:MAG: SCO family protein [Nitrospirae bacterium]|nr:SCO family protein [Nitrospirota bacterium]
MLKYVAISIFVPLLIAVGICEAKSHFAESEFNPMILKINEDNFLGKPVPDIAITDETGKKLSLHSLTNRPLILLLIYFDCPVMCPLLGEGLAGALENMKDLKTGSDYNVLVLSFNKNDSTAKAVSFHEQLKKKTSFPDVSKWVFATAKEEDIKALTEATGYRFFLNEDNMFVHPSVYIFLSPARKITRYIFGIKPDAFNIRLAILESAKGLTGKVPISSLVTLACYKYNSESHGYMLDITFLFESIGVFMAGMVGILSFIVYRKKTNLRRGE